MFTGIIETQGTVMAITPRGSSLSFLIRSGLAAELQVDQSLAHDGVCLTVEEVSDSSYQVTAVKETLDRTNIGEWAIGRSINLERCLAFNGRLDGHLVQGHIDTRVRCRRRKDLDGSWEFSFDLPGKFKHLIIEKGSVAINGISLTVSKLGKKNFSVAIIPYTFAHTNLQDLMPGMMVNVEFDLVGKYIARNLMVAGRKD